MLESDRPLATAGQLKTAEEFLCKMKHLFASMATPYMNLIFIE